MGSPKKVFLRAPYNYDVDAASDESGLYCEPGTSLTHQSFAEEVDINTLVKRFGIGQVPVVPVSEEILDLSVAPGDFREAMEMVRLGREAFDAQPASIRARFRNDPAELLAFVGLEANRAEARSLGLLKDPEAAAPATSAPLAAGSPGEPASGPGHSGTP